MEPMYYIGLDVHKRKISYCVKDSSGKVYAEGSIPATRTPGRLEEPALEVKKSETACCKDAGRENRF